MANHFNDLLLQTLKQINVRLVLMDVWIVLMDVQTINAPRNPRTEEGISMESFQRITLKQINVRLDMDRLIDVKVDKTDLDVTNEKLDKLSEKLDATNEKLDLGQSR